MANIDWNTASVEYRLQTTSYGRYVLLVLGCFLSAGPALVIMLLLATIDSLRESAVFAPLGVVVVLGTPVALYFIFRKWMRRPVTIRLEPGRIIIQRPGESKTLTTDKIKTFESIEHEVGDEDEAESVIIRDVNGKTTKITASTLSGSLRDMASFRVDFEQWAAAHKLTQWSPWFRR